MKKEKISLGISLIPLIVLIAILFLNIRFIYTDSNDDMMSGPNQWALICASMVAIFIGVFRKINVKEIFSYVETNIKSVSVAILVLLMVGALSGSWMIGGIVPAMVYYGLQIMSPTYFLPSALVISAIVSLMVGSSWNTSATIGVALIGVGKVLGFNEGMVAGAILSGAYFGDKMSPLSDTTNVASAMVGVDLFDHIRYMLYTTVPSILIALITFTFLGFSQQTALDTVNTDQVTQVIDKKFHITPFLFIAPLIVVLLIIKKVNAVFALFIGTILGLITAVVFQQNLLHRILATDSPVAQLKLLTQATVSDFSVNIGDQKLDRLFSTSGMSGMLYTIWLIICAMFFGGTLQGIGALDRITEMLLGWAKSAFGLFVSTVASCFFINISTADQYLSIVIPGKMFSNAYKKKGLASENLSRTLEDSGTVGSVLVPWNSCAAYHSKVLLIDPLAFIPYLVFNYMSPMMTLIVAAIGFKIKKIKAESNVSVDEKNTLNSKMF